MATTNKFKQTDIGEIPVEWEVDEIDNAFEFSRKPRSLDISDDDVIPFIPMDSISEVNEDVSYHEEKKWDEISSGSYIEKGDLIVAKITPSFENGKQALLKNLPKDFGYATTEIWALHPKQERKVETEFLYYFLKKKDVRIDLANKMEGSTGRQRVPRSTLANYKIPIPPLPEQKAIAQKLTVIRNAIEQTQAVIEATEALKKSMMKHLFTYGPVPADQTDQVELKETEVGRMNTEWGFKELGKVTDIQYGIQAAVANNLDPNIGIPILTNSNININGFIDLSEMKYYDIEQEKDPEKYLLQRKDVLFNWRSGSRKHVGKTVFFNLDEEMTHSSFILRIRSEDDEKLRNKYVFYFLTYLRKVNDFFERMHQFMINAKFNKSHTSKIPIPIPSIELQDQIIEKLDSVEEKLIYEKDRLNSLHETFESLLDSLMSAKIRVN